MSVYFSWPSGRTVSGGSGGVTRVVTADVWASLGLEVKFFASDGDAVWKMTDDRTGKLEPGTGSIGPDGTALLIDYESLGEKYKVYESGKLVAILSRDVEGKGNITYGYGILFNNTPQERKRLKDVYGLEFAEKVRVPIELCEKMYWDYINGHLKGLHEFALDNKMWLTQNQIDALIMHRHLVGSLGAKTQGLLQEMFKDRTISDSDLKRLYWDKLLEALLEDLQNQTSSANYAKYKNGWTSRILDELELFFDGDERRTH